MVHTCSPLCLGVVTNGGKWAPAQPSPAQPGAVLGYFIALSSNEETEEAAKIGPHFHYNAQRAGVGPFWGHSRRFITVPRCSTWDCSSFTVGSCHFEA